MLSMILQLGGLANLIVGISTASGHFVDAEIEDGKFDLYQ
jgi:hypothetical protein